MKKETNAYIRAITLSLFLWKVSPVTAQNTGDTTYLITSTDKQYSASPLGLSSNPYYNLIKPNQKGVRPTVLYNNDDRIYIGLNYNNFSEGWKPDSSGRRHRVFTYYSINQKALSTGYQGIFHQAFSGWNLFVDASFDWIKWMNFYGFGNETVQETEDRDFYRIRRREAMASLSLQKNLGKQSSFTVRPFYQHVRVMIDDERFLAKGFFVHDFSRKYGSNHFGGIRADLVLQRLNDLLLPTKGSVVNLGIAHVQNISKPRQFTNYSAYTRFFFPFLRNFVFSVESGAATLTGEPEFYQYNSIGGRSLRGYRSDRFWGETIFHNNNELQYIFNVNHRLFKGKMGLLAFADQGRVWKKGEQSNQWHYGYGGGIMLVPYRKIYVSIQYGISHERKGLHLDLRRSL